MVLYILNVLMQQSHASSQPQFFFFFFWGGGGTAPTHTIFYVCFSQLFVVAYVLLIKLPSIPNSVKLLVLCPQTHKLEPQVKTAP